MKASNTPEDKAIHSEGEKAQKLTWHEKRQTIRKETSFSQWLKVSLQECNVEDNVSKLLGLMKSTSSKLKRRKLLGLIAVFEELIAENGILDFKEAFDLFSAYQDTACDKDVFRDNLLDKEIGLTVVYFVHPVKLYAQIALRSTLVRVENIIENVLSNTKNKLDELDWQQEHDSLSNLPVFIHDPQYLKLLLKVMDTEFDRQVVKTIIAAALPSVSAIMSIGIDKQTAKCLTDKIEMILEEYQNCQLAAEDLVWLRIRDKLNSYAKDLESTNKQLEEQGELLNAYRVGQLKRKIDDLEDKIDYNESLLNPSNQKQRRILQACIKHTANTEFERNRIKRRKLGSGAPRKLDDEDEEFLRGYVEADSTSHGRRHDQVGYVNKGRKLECLHEALNEKRASEGKMPIKSKTTIYNRARPKRYGTKQAKLHIGKSYFCWKKPPKSVEEPTIHKIHNRSHIRLSTEHMCKDKDNLKFNLFKSEDAKAYYKPSTSVQFDIWPIVQSSDPAKVLGLPKYDFPIALLNVSPGSHRLQTKQPVDVSGETKYLPLRDESAVFFRSKEMIGSTGSVFSSEDLRLLFELPSVYEVEGSGRQYSRLFRTICHILRSKTAHLSMSLMKEDVTKVTTGCDDEYREFEAMRINNALYYINLAQTKYAKSNLPEHEKRAIQPVISRNELFQKKLTSVLDRLNSVKIGGEQLWQEYQEVLVIMNSLTDELVKLNLPDVKSNYHINSDAGPGSGISNYEVQLRTVEVFFINKLDRFHRLHTATQDSGYNLVERTNAAVGKAVVKNGGPINWAVNSLPEIDEMKQMSPAEIEGLEKEVLRKNCLEVCEELADRCNGAPGPRNYLHAFTSQQLHELFFWDADYLNEFMRKTKSSKSAAFRVPGSHYYSWLVKQKNLHVVQGEFSFELLKFACKNEHNNQCEMCKSWTAAKEILRCPYPFPDKERPYKYCKLKDTPTNSRSVDDYNPRVQACILHTAGLLKSTDHESVKQFSEKMGVEERLIEIYLLHLENKECKRQNKAVEREKARTEAKEKTFSDYKWTELYETGKLRKLKKNELEKYVKHFSLMATNSKTTKLNIIRKIERHIAGILDEQQHEADENDNDLVDDSDEVEFTDTEPDEGEQEISVEIEFDSEGGDDTEDEDNINSDLFCISNSEGLKEALQVELKCSRRRATTWQTRYFEDFVTWE